MDADSDGKRRWDDLSRSRSGFLAKTNPNVKTGVNEGEEPRGSRAEFGARTDPDYGRAPLTDEQKELATSHLPLAKVLAKQLRSRRHVDREEIESVAFVALVEAARCYQSTTGAQFATFARYRIVGAILDFFKKADRNRHVQSSTMTDLWGAAMDVEQYGIPIGVTPDLPVGTEFDAVDTVEFHFQPMSSAQARACRLIYVDGKSQEEAAEIMDCTPTYISKIHREAIELLFERSRDRADLRPVSGTPPAHETGRPGRDAWCQAQPMRGRTRMPKSRPLATAC